MVRCEVEVEAVQIDGSSNWRIKYKREHEEIVSNEVFQKEFKPIKERKSRSSIVQAYSAWAKEQSMMNQEESNDYIQGNQNGWADRIKNN